MRSNQDAWVDYNQRMTWIMALDTSTSTCGVALLYEENGAIDIQTRHLEGPSGHAASILPLISDLLKHAGIARADLDAVAFGQGPGAFTGLRVACGVSQGIGMALNIPLLPVGALLSAAARCITDSPQLLVPALDARMNEVYLACYAMISPGHIQAIQTPVLLRAQDALGFVNARKEQWQRASGLNVEVKLCSQGWSLVDADEISQSGWSWIDPQGGPDVEAVARLGHKMFERGEGRLPEHASPFYLRDKVAFNTAERESGQGGNPRALASGLGVMVPMTKADLVDVVNLERAVQSFPWSLQNFEDALQAGYEAWVLREAGELMGFCIGMVAPDVTHILVIAVNKAIQRKGAGRRLLAHLGSIARERGSEALLLEVRPSNEPARRFYDAMGFEQIGVRRGYYPAARNQREDALVMKKTLDDF